MPNKGHNTMSNTPIKAVKRNSVFLDKDVLRLDISNINDAKEIGRLIGHLISKTYDGEAPVKEAFLYGGYYSGKSSMANFIVSGFDNSEGSSIERQVRTQRISTTRPKCFHIDYRLHSGNPMIWKVIPEYGIPTIADDEILIGEWCEFLTEDYLLPDRLMLEIVTAKTIQDALAKTEYYAPTTRPQMAMLEFINRLPRARMLSIVGFGSGKEIVDAVAEARNDKTVELPSGE